MIDSIQVFDVYKQGLDKIESGLLKQTGIPKSWVTLLSSRLPESVLFHVQRIGCEPPVIEVSLDYMLSWSNLPAYNGKLRKGREQFKLYFAQAFRHAQLMSKASAFERPTQSVSILKDKKRAKLAQLRDSAALLPERFFMVQYIAVVTEIATPEQHSVVVQSSIHHQTPHELRKEGMRILSERILNDDSLRDLIELEHPTERVPLQVPTSVTLAAKNGAVQTMVSYQGYMVPVDVDVETSTEDEEDDSE